MERFSGSATPALCWGTACSRRDLWTAALDFTLQPHCCSWIIFPFSTQLRAC